MNKIEGELSFYKLKKMKMSKIKISKQKQIYQKNRIEEEWFLSRQIYILCDIMGYSYKYTNDCEYVSVQNENNEFVIFTRLKKDVLRELYKIYIKEEVYYKKFAKNTPEENKEISSKKSKSISYKNAILEWKRNNSHKPKKKCAEELGISPRTVRKWWNSEE